MSATENTFSAILGEETTDAINDYLTNHQKDKQYIMAVAQTGKGKSWYVKNKLYDYCKERGFKILYLLPRKVVKEEFILELKGNDEGEIDKTDVIKVYTYQQIERLDRWVSPQQFNIIICDECHYFISDSFFNVRTERSYNRLLEYAPDAAFLFITATPKPIEAVLDFDLHERDKKLCTGSIKPDFSIIKEIRFISADSPKQKDEASTKRKMKLRKIFLIIFQTEKRQLYFVTLLNTLINYINNTPMIVCSYVVNTIKSMPLKSIKRNTKKCFKITTSIASMYSALLLLMLDFP